MVLGCHKGSVSSSYCCAVVVVYPLCWQLCCDSSVDQCSSGRGDMQLYREGPCSCLGHGACLPDLQSSLLLGGDTSGITI